MIGQTLGHYRIESKLGEGGMGVVYKARDTHLDRPVAIKVLSADAVANPERKRRFAQEAKAASALNHPNILHIYDIDAADGVDFIAMEYVEGYTLDELIGHKGLKLGEALKYAVQIADGLAAAHAAGVVHRDIKPGNIMVNEKGLVKILDFGLAKLTEPGESDEFGSTQTMRPRTAEGAIVGTVAYMSTEQAEGKKVDARSDIFSFGSVLYEMLTGRRAFQGETKISTLAAILHHDPKPVRELVDGIPHDVERTVARCLRKDPSRRIQHMDDVKLALEDVKEEGDSPTAPPVAAPRKRTVPVLVALAGIALVLGLAYWLLTPAESGVSSYRFTPLATEAEEETWPAWSPDGKSIAYLADVKGVMQVFTRSLGSATPVQITKSSSNCDSLFWHPDGTRIYYTSERHLWSIGTAGGEPQIVIKDAQAGTISPDGKTLAIVRGGLDYASLWVASAQDANAQPYKQAPFPEKFRDGAAARFSPDGSKIGVVLSLEAGGGGYEFWIVPHPSGRPRRALASLTANAPIQGFSWMPDSRHLVFGAALPGVSGRHICLADTEKNTVDPITSGTSEEAQPSVSPDGKSIAFTSGGTDFDLIESPLEGGPIRTLLATSRNERTPGWSPSGGQYAYSTNANGVVEIWLRSLAEGWARPVVTRALDGLPLWDELRSPRFSPDGQRIVYQVWGLNHTIWISTLAGGRPVRLDTESLDHHGPSWSPDGNWIAYMRLQEGQWALVKTPVGGGKPVVVVEKIFSFETDWSPSGEWICYNSPEGVQLVSPDGKTRRLLNRSTSSTFGFSKDGSTVYIVRRGQNRRWEVAAIDVRSATERRVSELSIPPAAALAGFSLHPNGKSFATSVGTTRYDIWLLEDFQPPSRWWRFGRRDH